MVIKKNTKITTWTDCDKRELFSSEQAAKDSSLKKALKDVERLFDVNQDTEFDALSPLKSKLSRASIKNKPGITHLAFENVLQDAINKCRVAYSVTLE